MGQVPGRGAPGHLRGAGRRGGGVHLRRVSDRDWTRLERRAAFGRAVRERREYVLPARFDDTPLPGLLSDMVSVDLRRYAPGQFAEMVADKLAGLDITAPTPAAPVPLAGPGGTWCWR